MEDCIFCKIIKGEVPAKKEAETQNLIAIWDINPKASVHLLIIPKEHVIDITDDKGTYWESIGKLVTKIALERKIKSFRLVHNAGGASLIKHMHVHFLAEVTEDREL